MKRVLRAFHRIVSIVLMLLLLLTCAVLTGRAPSIEPVLAQNGFNFAPLALKVLEVTVYPLSVTENTEAQITLSLRDVTSTSSPTVIPDDSQVTVIVGSYITTATVGKGGTASVTLPPEVVTGSRLVGVVIVPGYQRTAFALVVKPMELKSSSTAAVEQAELEVELEVGKAWCWVNGKVTKLPVAPYIKEGRTMVPVRFFAEILGYTVDYDFSDPAMKKVMIYTPDSLPNTTAVREKQQAKKPSPFITLFIDQTTVIIGGISVEMDSAPQLVKGTTMVPLRFVAQILGFYVEWKDSMVKLVSSF